LTKLLKSSELWRRVLLW